MYIEKVAASQASMLTAGTVSPHRNNAGVKHVSNPTLYGCLTFVARDINLSIRESVFFNTFSIIPFPQACTK